MMVKVSWGLARYGQKTDPCGRWVQGRCDAARRQFVCGPHWVPALAVFSSANSRPDQTDLQTTDRPTIQTWIVLVLAGTG